MNFTVQKSHPEDEEKALFVGSDVYREAAFGKHHPLSIIRVAGVMDICEIMGWFEPGQFRESPRASVEQLQEFHQSDYIQAIIKADARGSVDKETRERYRIGTMENSFVCNICCSKACSIPAVTMAASIDSSCLIELKSLSLLGSRSFSLTSK